MTLTAPSVVMTNKGWGGATAPGELNAPAGRSLTAYDDDALMVRSQGRDREAFEVLVSRHSELVIAIACRFLADREAGRDVAQDVFTELWVKRDRYVPGGKFKGYLSTLVLNRCRDATRRRGAENRRRRGLTLEGFERPADPAEQASKKQSAVLLESKLGELPDEDRELLVMRYGLDLPYDEISAMTGRPTGTLRSRVFHSLRKLRALLEGAS